MFYHGTRLGGNSMTPFVDMLSTVRTVYVCKKKKLDVHII